MYYPFVSNKAASNSSIHVSSEGKNLRWLKRGGVFNTTTILQGRVYNAYFINPHYSCNSLRNLVVSENLYLDIQKAISLSFELENNLENPLFELKGSAGFYTLNEHTGQKIKIRERVQLFSPVLYTKSTYNWDDLHCKLKTNKDALKLRVILIKLNTTKVFFDDIHLYLYIHERKKPKPKRNYYSLKSLMATWLILNIVSGILIGFNISELLII